MRKITYNKQMKKSEAIELFGTIGDLAKGVRVTTQAISQWPDILTDRLKFQVVGAAYLLGKFKGE